MGNTRRNGRRVGQEPNWSPTDYSPASCRAYLNRARILHSVAPREGPDPCIGKQASISAAEQPEAPQQSFQSRPIYPEFSRYQPPVLPVRAPHLRHPKHVAALLQDSTASNQTGAPESHQCVQVVAILH